MASQFWQPGSVGVLIAAQDTAEATAVFCGIGVFSPETQFVEKFKPIHDDYSGSMIRAEEGFGGEEAFVSVDFIRYDMAGIDLIANVINTPSQWAAPLTADQTRGEKAFGAIGTLMQTQQKYMRLYLLNMNMLPLGAPTKFVNQPLGYLFFCSRPSQLALPRKDLPDAQMTRVSFECINEFNLGAGNLPGWNLYNTLSPAEQTALAAKIG